MHIALLSNFLPPDEEYGIARYVLELSYALADRGHDIKIISGSPIHKQATELRENLKIYWVKNEIKSAHLLPSLTLLKFSYHLKTIISILHEKKPFDVVEYPNLTFPGLATVFNRLSNPHPLFIMRLSSPSIKLPISGMLPWRLTLFFETCQARLSDAYIGNTKENLTICKRSYNLSDKKPSCVILHSLPNGPTPKLFFNDKPQNKVLFLGRIEPRKGFDVLAKSWEKVIKYIPTAKLIVAGENRPWRGSNFFDYSLSQLKSETKKNIEYIGFVSSDQKERLYRECDIFVAPSRYESFGLVFLEAMRYGKPVVSCNVGGIPEVVTHGQTGFLVPPEIDDKLAESIILLLQNSELRYKMGIAALQSLNERFTKERIADQTDSFYRHVLCKK